jgi:glycosyltransferase involved in cell wall biosynthesis
MEKNNIFISVVIPLYNKAHTIVHTIQTVIKQTYDNYELIIIDDGSTDNSVQLIKDNFSDTRIRIIQQENAGVSVARNRGVQEAKGEWIAFLDADDEWLPQYLQTLTSALIRYPDAEMIGCASFYKDFQTNKYSCNAIIDRYYKKIIKINYFMNPDKMTHIGATILKKNVFLQIGGFNTSLRINEDLLLLALIALRQHFIYIGDLLHVYVGNISGQSTSIKSKYNSDMKNKLYVINAIYQAYVADGKRNCLVPIAMKYRFLHYIILFLKSHDYFSISYFLDNIDKSLKLYIGKIDWMKNPQYNKLAIIYIYATKLLWRTHGYPRVGEKSKYENEIKKLIYE